MTYQTFIENIKDYLTDYYNDESEVRIQTISKNNNIQLDGLSILDKDSNICPTIYLNDFYSDYENGNKSIQEIIDSIIVLHNSHKKSKKFSIDISYFTEYEKVKNKIAYKLVNFNWNKELLKDIPHIPYLDLAICFFVEFDSQLDNQATILIRNEHLDLWEITDQELYNVAIHNTPKLFPERFVSMNTIIDSLQNEDVQFDFESIDDTPSIPDPGMYILTNQKNMYGASSILYEDLLYSLSKQFNTSFYILPCSIHEVILIPTNDKSRLEELNEMVQSVNRESVNEVDMLSDHAYYYDVNEKALFIE